MVYGFKLHASPALEKPKIRHLTVMLQEMGGGVLSECA